MSSSPNVDAAVARTERERAVGYLQRKGTSASPAELRARVARTLSRLEQALATLDSRRATRKPDPGTWCVQEIVNHLTVSLESAIGKFEALISGRPTGGAIPVGLIEEDAMSASWEEARRRSSSAHERFLRTVDRALAAPPPLDRTVLVAMLLKVPGADGEPRPLEWTEPLDWKALTLIAHVHTLEHLDQIGRVLERVDAAVELRSGR